MNKKIEIEYNEGEYFIAANNFNGKIVKDECGWLLIDELNIAENVTLLPSGEIDWSYIINKVLKS